jgi:hypothetical protein
MSENQQLVEPDLAYRGKDLRKIRTYLYLLNPTFCNTDSI